MRKSSILVRKGGDRERAVARSHAVAGPTSEALQATCKGHMPEGTRHGSFENNARG